MVNVDLENVIALAHMDVFGCAIVDAEARVSEVVIDRLAVSHDAPRIPTSSTG
jgi:hypothetical protein